MSDLLNTFMLLVAGVAIFLLIDMFRNNNLSIYGDERFAEAKEEVYPKKEREVKKEKRRRQKMYRRARWLTKGRHPSDGHSMSINSKRERKRVLVAAGRLHMNPVEVYL